MEGSSDMSEGGGYGEDAMLRQQAQIRRFRCPIRDAGIESGTVAGCPGAACAAPYRHRAREHAADAIRETGRDA
jgi:hypothetical protein